MVRGPPWQLQCAIARHLGAGWRQAPCCRTILQQENKELLRLNRSACSIVGAIVAVHVRQGLPLGARLASGTVLPNQPADGK